MIRKLQPLALLALLLASCDKQRRSSMEHSQSEESQPLETKRIRPSIEDSESTGEDHPVDPQEALKAAEEIPASAARDKALAEVAWNTIETDPEICEQACSKLAADNPERIRLIQHFAMRRAEQDPDDALNWAETLDSEAEISAAKCQIALVLAESDPLKAAGLLSENAIPGREFDVKIVEVVQRWAEKSPPEAAAWVGQFQAGPVRSDGLREVLARWIDQDPKAVFTWKEGLADPTLKHDVLNALTELAAGESTAKWLEQADAETREAVQRAKEHSRPDGSDPQF